MFKILQSLASSFDTSDKGASARKLSAFVSVVLSVFLSIKCCDAQTLPEVLMIWLTFASVCLGLTTYEKSRFNREKNSEVLPGESESKS